MKSEQKSLSYIVACTSWWGSYRAQCVSFMLLLMLFVLHSRVIFKKNKNVDVYSVTNWFRTGTVWLLFYLLDEVGLKGDILWNATYNKRRSINHSLYFMDDSVSERQALSVSHSDLAIFYYLIQFLLDFVYKKNKKTNQVMIETVVVLLHKLFYLRAIY